MKDGIWKMDDGKWMMEEIRNKEELRMECNG